MPYYVDPDRVTLSPNATEGLRLFSRMGYTLLVVSNQAGVARGFFPESALEAVWRRIDRLLAAEDVQLDGYYYCPHHIEGTVGEYAQACDCRKPLPGMLLQAAAEHDIDLEASWMVGDILHDMEAGKRAGCRTILIDNGNETEWNLTPERIPDLTAPDLHAAALLVAAMAPPIMQPMPVNRYSMQGEMR